MPLKATRKRRKSSKIHRKRSQKKNNSFIYFDLDGLWKTCESSVGALARIVKFSLAAFVSFSENPRSS
jgi:hypothetical protein